MHLSFTSLVKIADNAHFLTSKVSIEKVEMVMILSPLLPLPPLLANILYLITPILFNL